MRTVVLALLLAPSLFAYQTVIPVGTAAAGKTAWGERLCRWCHGEAGEGGFGPDLAGRALTYNQFRRAIRQPWGVMPAFTEAQANDQVIADLQAYLMTLSKVNEPGPLKEKTPAPDAPRGQQLFASYGCMQCHGPEGQRIRELEGGEAADVDFPFFAKLVYTHTERYRLGRMGNFSKLRVTEASLQEIYRFLFDDLGYLAPVNATVGPGSASGGNTVYTLEVDNRGGKGKGITPEGLTIALALALGTNVVSGTGVGYQGVRADSELKSQAAVWQLPKLAPGEKQTYTLTVVGSAAKPADIFKGSVVRWAKPEIRKGVPNLALRDPRIPGKDPQIFVVFPAPVAP